MTVQAEVAKQTLKITFPQRPTVMDLVPFAEAKLGPATDKEAPLTQRALARLDEQPELVHLGVCLSLYLGLYPDPGTMLRDLPAPESSKARSPTPCAATLCAVSQVRMRCCCGTIYHMLNRGRSPAVI